MTQMDPSCEREEVAGKPREELNNAAKNIADCTGGSSCDLCNIRRDQRNDWPSEVATSYE